MGIVTRETKINHTPVAILLTDNRRGSELMEHFPVCQSDFGQYYLNIIVAGVPAMTSGNTPNIKLE